MKTLPFALVLSAIFTTPALAEEAFPFESSSPYDGGAFQVDVPCAEQAVRNYLGGNLSEFNSEVGIIFGATDQTNVIVILSGERAESNLARVDWIVVNQGEQHSLINYNGLNGDLSYSFMQVMAGTQEAASAGEHSVQALEEYLRSCGSAGNFLMM